MDAGTSPPTSAARPPRLSRQGKVVVGVLLTLVGLFFLGGTLPSAPSALARALTVAGVGIVTLWLGGIFLGLGGRR